MNRYTITIELDIWAEDNDEAREMANEFAAKERKANDNAARVTEIFNTPYGSLMSRKVELLK